MIKVKESSNTIIITGHANFAEYGKDIVCASVSSIVTTSINAALRLESNSLVYKEEKDKLTIEIKSTNKNILCIIENMLAMLTELADTYPKNIQIIKEERP